MADETPDRDDDERDEHDEDDDDHDDDEHDDYLSVLVAMDRDGALTEDPAAVGRALVLLYPRWSHLVEALDEATRRGALFGRMEFWRGVRTALFENGPGE
jgi:hypothetical protein